jgi:predicted glycosyltransferase
MARGAVGSFKGPISMKKVMFYCQYLAGMGHLVRSTEIIRSLAKDFQVCFINGGQPIPGFHFPVAVEVVHLPPIVEVDGELAAVDSFESIEEIKQSRKNQLLQVFEQFQPDCLMIECFPFSKHKLKFELIPLLDCAVASKTQVMCSLRDLIMTQTLSPTARMKRCDKVRDLVLIHGDPQVQRLEEQFPKVEQLNCEIYYTGYVVQSPPEQLPLDEVDTAIFAQPTPMIVASAGGGRFGYDLLNAVVNASKILQTRIPHQFQIFTGPFMPDAQVAELQAVASENLMIRRFTPHLIQYLERADLSISLGGYNTTMNILRTGARSLIFPAASEEQTGEQTIRAAKLAQKGILDVLTIDDLQPNRLAEKILTALQHQPVSHSFDLQGAEKSAARLKQLLYGAAIAA